MARQYATIVVIGILAVRLKSFNTEAICRRDLNPPPKDIGGEDWEVGANCARNMPWRPNRSEFTRGLIRCFASRPQSGDVDRDRRYLLSCCLPVACRWRSHRTSRAPSPKQAPAYPDHTRLMVVRDGQGRERPIRSLADWNVRRDHILSHFQEVAGTLPGGERRVPLDLKVISTEKDPGLHARRSLSPPSPETVCRHGCLIPDHATKPAVRASCGPVPASDDRHRQGRARRTRPEPRIGLRARARWKEVTSPWLPTIPTSANTRSNVYDLGYASATMKAIWNNLRAVDLLCSLDEVDPATNRRHRPLTRGP